MRSPPLKVGDLARATGLSVRTLHYYDEIGLLSPSHRTRSGHRLYTEGDIARLQQIMSLRQLGIHAFTGGNPAIETSLNKMYRQEPDLLHRNGFDPAVAEYMGKARQ